VSDLQDFISKYISSIEQLEILLLLFENPERYFGPSEISGRFRSNQDSVQARLRGLINNGFVIRGENEQKDRYRYSAPSDLLHQQVGALREAYAKKRSTIINFIYTGQTQLVKSSPVHDLANAFKFGKDKR
jgi:predicted transcriptional regulator